MIQVKVTVEIPKGSKYKYEKYHDHNCLYLDRILNQKVPYNYGFINNIPAPDGDYLDVFIISNEPIPSLTECEVEIIGGYKCIDNGIQDDKLIGVLIGDDIYPNLVSIEQYLKTYKEGFEFKGKLTEEEIRRLVKPTHSEWVMDQYKDYDWSKVEGEKK